MAFMLMKGKRKQRLRYAIIAEHENIRVRIIDYSPDDHHQPFTITGLIVYCLKGEITSTGTDGCSIIISKGMLIVLPEKKILYKVNSLVGAKLLVIDRPLNREKTEPNPWRM